MTGTRLNDCTPASDEQARYTMNSTEEERLAQISSQPWQEREHLAHVDRAFLLRLLGEAQAEITEQQSEIGELAAKVGPVTERNGELRGRVRELEAEIARLRAPPAADAMELAKHLYNMARYPAANDDGGKRTIDGIARALTAYGDQRAREARQQMLVDSTPLREAVARKARAAAFEAVKEALIPTPDTLTNEWAFGWEHARDKALLALRALAGAPTPSEDRHLTPSEHKVMNRALLRSVRPVDPPQSEGGEG